MYSPATPVVIVGLIVLRVKIEQWETGTGEICTVDISIICNFL